MGSLTTLLFTFTGRVNRAKYWLALAIYLAITVLLIAIGLIMFGNSLLAIGDEETDDIVVGLLSRGIGFTLIVLVVYIPMVISGFMVGIKRLHDRDKSGWWLLVFYVLPGVLSTIGESLAAGWIFSLASFASLALGARRARLPARHCRAKPIRARSACFITGETCANSSCSRLRCCSPRQQPSPIRQANIASRAPTRAAAAPIGARSALRRPARPIASCGTSRASAISAPASATRTSLRFPTGPATRPALPSMAKKAAAGSASGPIRAAGTWAPNAGGGQ